MILAINGCVRANGLSYTMQTVSQVLANGGAPNIPTIIWDDLAREGSAKATHNLIKECFRQYPGEDVLLLEDDVECCKNAVLAAEKFEAPDGCEMVSFYNNRVRFTREYGAVDRDYMDAINPRYTWMLRPIAGHYVEKVDDGFVYAQALRLSAKLIEFIATHQWPKNLVFTPEEKNYVTPFQIRDRYLGHLASLISRYVTYVVPNWFEHIGDTSAIIREEWDPTNRLRAVRAGNFISVEHDALTDDVSCYFHGLPRSQ